MLSLLTLSLLPLALTTPIPSSYTWSVTGWSAGCARAGCYYDFNVTGAAVHTADLQIPAFKAYCAGSESYKYDGAVYTPFRQCTLLDVDGESAGYDEGTAVAADLEPNELGDGKGARIRVSLRFDGTQEGSYYNYTGGATSIYNQFSAPEQNFTITPTEAVSFA